MMNQQRRLKQRLTTAAKTLGAGNRGNLKSALNGSWKKAEVDRRAAVLAATRHPVAFGEFLVDPTTGEVPEAYFESRPTEVTLHPRTTLTSTVDEAVLTKCQGTAYRFPAAWTVETAEYGTLKENAPQTGTEMKLMLEAATEAFEAGQRGAISQEMQDKLAVPAVFSAEDRARFRREGLKVAREAAVAKVLAQTPTVVVPGTFWPMANRMMGRPLPSWTVEQQTRLAQDGVNDPRLVVGQEIPVLNVPVWNDLVGLPMELPGDPDEVLGVVTERTPTMAVRNELLADLQLVAIAAKRFDAHSSSQTAIEYVVQRAHTIVTYGFDEAEWGVVGRDVAYEDPIHAAPWVVNMLANRAQMVAPVAHSTLDGPGGGVPAALVPNWPDLSDAARLQNFSAQVVRMHQANGRRPGGRGGRNVRRRRGG